MRKSDLVDQVIREVVASAPPPPTLTATSARPGRNYRPTAVFAVAALVVLIGSVVALSRGGSPDTVVSTETGGERVEYQNVQPAATTMPVADSLRALTSRLETEYHGEATIEAPPTVAATGRSGDVDWQLEVYRLREKGQTSECLDLRTEFAAGGSCTDPANARAISLNTSTLPALAHGRAPVSAERVRIGLSGGRSIEVNTVELVGTRSPMRYYVARLRDGETVSGVTALS